jgi:hypothetical protein
MPPAILIPSCFMPRLSWDLKIVMKCLFMLLICFVIYQNYFRVGVRYHRQKLFTYPIAPWWWVFRLGCNRRQRGWKCFGVLYESVTGKRGGCDVTFLLLGGVHSLPPLEGGREAAGGGDGCRWAVVAVNPRPRRTVVVVCLFWLYTSPHVRVSSDLSLGTQWVEWL